jgi:hypothetical protein
MHPPTFQSPPPDPRRRLIDSKKRCKVCDKSSIGRKCLGEKAFFLPYGMPEDFSGVPFLENVFSRITQKLT